MVAAVLTLALRLLYSAAAAALVPTLKLDPILIHPNPFADALMEPSDGLRYLVLGVWERFDTLWYIHIAVQGYDRPEAVVFYPLYPFLIRLVSIIIWQPVAAAVLVSTIASFFLFYALGRLLSLDLSTEQVRRAIICCGLWPAAFVFFAGYAESLVLALIVWSVYFARSGRWWLAGIVGFFAGLAKAVGILTVAPLAVLAWRQKSWRAAPAVLCLVGPPLFFAFLRAAGQPLPTAAYAIYWKTEPAWPWTTLGSSLQEVFQQGHIGVGVNLALFVLAFALAFVDSARREYLCYVAAALALLLTKKSPAVQQQWARYALIVFPAYANVGRILEDRILFAGVLLTFAIINVILLRAFLEWSMVV